MSTVHNASKWVKKAAEGKDMEYVSVSCLPKK